MTTEEKRDLIHALLCAVVGMLLAPAVAAALAAYFTWRGWQ